MNPTIRALAALVASVSLFATTAGAQVIRSDWQPPASALRFSTPGVREALAAPRSEHFIAQQSTPAPSQTRERRNRKIAGLILGGLGGFFAGGFIGAKVEPNCGCDDPGLQGFIIGAPIGTILGAIAGYKIASR